MDPRRGNEIAWAQADSQNGPFNSIGHALRVLTGRWEMGIVNSDPMCAGGRALDLLQPAGSVPTGSPPPITPYGADFSARVEDATIDTPGRATAVRLFEDLGLVIPPSDLASLSSADPHNGVASLLIERRQIQEGVSLPELGLQADAIRASVETIADADLRFAADRAFRTWQWC